MNPLRHLFDFDRPATTGERLFFRLFELFVVFAVVELAWDWGTYLLRISDVVLALGIAQYVDVSFLFGNGASLVNAALVTAFAALGFLRIGRFSYLVAFGLLHLQYAARFVLGEIPHSANLVGMAFLGVALAAACFPQPRHQRRFALGFTYFFTGLGYTLAAFCKLIGTGPLWSDGRHLWMWIHEKGIDAFAKTGVPSFNALQEIALDSLTAATLFLTVGLVTEFFAFLIWWRPLRTPVALGIIGLHMGIWATMNILFLYSTILLVVIGLPWALWIDASLPVLRRSAVGERIEGALLRVA